MIRGRIADARDARTVAACLPEVGAVCHQAALVGLGVDDGRRLPRGLPAADSSRRTGVCRGASKGRTLRGMSRTILTVVGILLAIWVAFMVIGAIIAAVKFLFVVGLIALIVTFAVVVVGRLSRSR